MNSIRLTPALALLCALAACNAGKDNVLFSTRTITALDIDSTPAAFDLGYARTEVTIAPTFEQDQTLPVMTTVGGSTKGLNLTSDHSFGTGDAVLVMADALLSEERYYFAGETAAARAKPRVPLPGSITDRANPWSGVVFTRIAPGDRRPFFFGTDTSLGAHLEFTSGALPTSGSVGFKRKELACVPLIEEEVLINGVPHLRVQVASLLAIAAVKFGSGSIGESGTRTGQAYATGPAATLLATHPAVRLAVAPALVGEATVQAAAALNTAALFDRQTGITGLRFLLQVYEAIEEAAGDVTNKNAIRRRKAVRLKEDLDALAAELEYPEYPLYGWSATAPHLSVDVIPAGQADDFSDWTSYMWAIHNSLNSIDKAQQESQLGALADQAATDRAILDARIDGYAQKYSDAEVLIDAKAFFDELLTNSED
jgi:hypothetical protein